MKKTITFILIILGLINLKLHPKIKKENINEHIETLNEKALSFIKEDDNNILLSISEIQKYNQNISKNTNSLYDLEKITSLSKEEVLNYINLYKLPELPKYNSNKKITKNEINYILENRNISDVKNITTPKKGLIIKRSNLRSLPTNINFFPDKDTKNFDSIQETELTINTKILILHQSKDKMWSLIISPTYIGWVENTNITYATDADWDYFDNTKSFIIITEPSLTIDNLILDMGVKLPYLKFSNDNYIAIIPTKNNKNYVTKKIITINKKHAHIGYLPYTKRNIINQAFKYEDTPYSWGGMNKNVDCSSLILNIYKTFGFIFPRNTKEQQKSIGKITYLSNKTNQEKLDIISKNRISLLYKPGHVMLYLGESNKEHYIIHATKETLKVTISKLEETSNLSKIDRLVTIF